MTEIVVPTLGESVAEATVAQWLKKEGDSVEQDEAIVELETDKVTLEVNAPEAGVIAKIIVGEGENVEVGAILGEISAGAVAVKDQDNEKAEAKSEVKEVEKTDKVESGDHKLPPAVQKLVDENNLNPADIPASGKDGRLTKADVVDFMEGKSSTPVVKSSPTPSAPSPSLSGASRDVSAREEKVKMTKLRQTIANRLKEAQHTAAILTTFNEVDMSAVMNLRKEYKDRFEKKYGVKLGFMSFFVKAAVQALQEFPAVNAEISGTDIIYKNYYNIGVAVSTPQGLIVPVLRDADQKSMADVEKEIIDMGGRARDGKLGVEEMLGGTFTITNGGVFGSLMSTPILNAPQSAILGMHKIQQRPMVMPDGSIEARPMMYLALSYDHRIIDGRESVSFLVKIKEAIEDPQRLILNI
jgi:2-oxoglutarate dehydrogenase E2 component (dihydrolipoamide succinyltransferase)